MSIVGIGTDIINISRIKNIFAKYSTRFLEKNFHVTEVAQYMSLPERKRTSYLAKRFAAKEAIAKALGTGIGLGLRFKDVAIINNKLGAPIATIYTGTGIANHYSDYNIYVSLSDEAMFAVAFVVISQ